MTYAEQGRSDAEIESFWLASDEAWERIALLASLVHNSTITNQNHAKPPDDFNLPLVAARKWKREEEEAEYAAEQDGEAWIDEAAAKVDLNGQQVEH